ncbi:regulatory protein RecX [uncultured Desulfosarcina sp.]|uniref:regulatory protein RecX n=1 Tax=uncultured Desulfosarcina sp. TaxID=218289 RepID=UPI0029C734DD|nr:regulatory protein RecX [uncultured Desulfosarcina sp.]
MTGPTQSEALQSAFRILARRDHTTNELAQKLRRKGYGRKAVDGALERCRELGYLDDARTARMMAGHLVARGYGPLRIRQVLGQKGLEETLVERVMAAGESEDNQVRAAKKALEKKASRLGRESDPWKRRQIAYRFLTGRGFSSAVVNRAIDDISLLRK